MPLTSSNIGAHLFVPFQKALNASSDGRTCETLGDCILKMLPHVIEGEYFAEKIAPFVLSNAESSAPEARKVFSCLMMGRLAALITPEKFQEKMLDRGELMDTIFHFYLSFLRIYSLLPICSFKELSRHIPPCSKCHQSANGKYHSLRFI